MMRTMLTDMMADSGPSTATKRAPLLSTTAAAPPSPASTASTNTLGAQFANKLTMVPSSRRWRKYVFLCILGMGLMTIFFFSGTLRCNVWPKNCGHVTMGMATKYRQAKLHNIFSDLKSQDVVSNRTGHNSTARNGSLRYGNNTYSSTVENTTLAKYTIGKNKHMTKKVGLKKKIKQHKLDFFALKEKERKKLNEFKKNEMIPPKRGKIDESAWRQRDAKARQYLLRSNDKTMDETTEKNQASQHKKDTNSAKKITSKSRLSSLAAHKNDLKPSSGVANYKTYEEALKDRADENEIIVLASLDYGYVDMALNLWETSFVKFGIENFLFVCSDVRAQEALHKKAIPCFLGKIDKDGGHISSYGTAGFARKTHIKTTIILDALQLGYTVLIVDVDIVFFKNPFPYLTCDECDLQIQNDGPEINSGFYYVRPTKASVSLHLDALELADRSRGLSNQQALHRTLKQMRLAEAINAEILDSSTFPVGNIFFENGHRMFYGDNPCKTCVLVHDNWMVGGPAKVYRLKEFLLWVIDNDQYYSSETRKYLTFNNPVDFSSGTKKQEEDTLFAAMAIGHILNRVVILPTFHCHGCTYGSCRNRKNHCSLNTHFRLKDFDASFEGLYREHMFLQNSKVPTKVKESQSGIILIESRMSKLHSNDTSFGRININHTYTPKDLSGGATSQEILNWFKTPQFEKFHVLRFHSLYGAFADFLSEHKDMSFSNRLNQGFRYADYRQY